MCNVSNRKFIVNSNVLLKCFSTYRITLVEEISKSMFRSITWIQNILITTGVPKGSVLGPLLLFWAAAVCKLLKILNCLICRWKKLFCCSENWRQHWNLKRFKSQANNKFTKQNCDKLCMSYIGFHHHKPLASSSVHYLLVSWNGVNGVSVSCLCSV